MKRLFCGLVSSVALVVVLSPSVAAGAEYATYVGCSSTADAVPSHVCQIGDEPGAFFESMEEVEYETCVTFPSGNTLCAEEQFAEEQVLYVNEITTNIPGNHLVTWYVQGVEVGAWTFRMDQLPAPTPPAQPAPAPVVVPPVPVVGIPAGPSPACQRARKRVITLQRQLGTAGRPAVKATIRQKLRKARASVRRAC
jgi:hypothetical protein